MITLCLFCGGDASEPDHWRRCDGRQGALEAALPAGPDLRGMVHSDDPQTSIESAAVIERKRTELHERVLDAFATHGALTDEELECLPEFEGFGPSTIRKRRSELAQAHHLVPVGVRRNSRNRNMLIWRLAS